MNNQERQTLLSIKDLHVWFELRRFGIGRAGYVRAVDGVSFDLNHGEAIAIVGESGCGKSTLMKTILGLTCPPGAKSDFRERRSTTLEQKGFKPIALKWATFSKILMAHCHPS